MLSLNRRLHRFIPVLAVALAACGESATLATYQGEDRMESFWQTNFNRYYNIHVPERQVAGPVAPLVLALHGYGQNSRDFRASTGLDAAADQHGFIVVYLQAAMGAWDIFGGLGNLGLDDIDYVRRAIDQVTRLYPVDEDRIVAVGLSNGGVFAQQLACKLSNRIAGFVSVAATMPHLLADECAADRPVNAFYLVGTADTQFPFEGNETLLSFDGMMSAWARTNGCGGRRNSAAIPDRAEDGTRVYWSRYDKCDNGVRTWMDSIVGGGHAWPDAVIPPGERFGPTSRDINANDEIARFLQGLRR
ncbi:MAG TPA: PHB depolymerase family esterase [Gemmatimonadales bacterium]|nr:PHB depolymerase family esterase [Gemmatimonadales bacterium]